METELKNVLPFWYFLSEKDRQLVVKSLEQLLFQKGAKVYHVKKEDAGLKILISGRIRVFLSTSDGNEITLYRIENKNLNIWSVFSMMSDGQIDINMEAEEDSVVYWVPETICKKLSDECSAVSEFIWQVGMKHLQAVISVVQNLAFTKSSKRLADSLIAHSRWNQSEVLFITHEELANDIGTAREVVSRLLKKFEKLGFVSLSRGKIDILDFDGLKKI
ncbi:Crp/Fnr family transcriptional regulator [Velocimicrobium porci]|uniref:Crp/Fnr family transcriptional regulator n=1 Tax=Velocimicrobium porci TaxID=2606634 RepID=A0A6L5XUG5_9FIRM|nr:Crp/Fnr family transcriptional regulator [Velocimicrobium porci]MSS62322.1 Crp/Fnr family transcriptional regulator [Velocimicrobium porci]